MNENSQQPSENNEAANSSAASEGAGNKETVQNPDVSESPTPIAEKSNQSPLTERETQVLILADQGYSNKEIAQNLSIAENTVEVHLKQINCKLGTKNRRRASTKARENGWLQGK